MNKKVAKSILSTALLLTMTCASVGCGGSGGTNTGDGTKYNVSLLMQGWTNTPTTDSDPYMKWISDNYNLNVTLNATTDFTNSVMIGFSSTNKPNIVSFPTFTSFQSLRNQGVLLTDWTPYLDLMPNFKKMLYSDSQAFTKQVLTDSDGNLNAIWTPAETPTWSLKIREDWAEEYRALTADYDQNGNVTTEASDVYVPAGATVTDGGEWMPETPEDLLYFARYIKVFKNKGLDKADYFGFTTAGGGTSLGTLETWMPLMWGRVPVAPYGFYVNSDNEIAFSTTDGTYELYLDYLKQIVSEELIDPNWFSQSFSNDKRTTYGKIGIQWYPGSITSSTDIDANAGKSDSEKVDTTDWWETYPLPVSEDSDNEFAGYMAGEGLAGNIITVSKQTAMNKGMMEQICKLIDDCYANYDATTDTYKRGKAYDALRWGVGVDSGMEYLEIKGTNLVYCNTDGDGNTYRSIYTGAWDWGAWISSSYDGVVQGLTKDITSITLKVAEHNLKTATYKTTPQIGEYLTLDSSLITDMTLDMASFAYKYATGTASKTVSEYCDYWKTSLKGNELLQQAAQQYKALGLMK